MFNRAFNGHIDGNSIDLVPPTMEAEIDELNELVYQRINNGAYKAGFARTQSAYERAYRRYSSLHPTRCPNESLHPTMSVERSLGLRARGAAQLDGLPGSRVSSLRQRE